MLLEELPALTADFISSDGVSVLRAQIPDDRDQIQPGDLVLTLGAGSVWRAGEEFLEAKSATP